MKHEHGHAEDHAHAGAGNLGFALALNLAFTLVEVVGGLWTNSVAVLTDAVHDLGDSISLALAWWLDRYSRRGRTARYTYGYRRYSLLGGLVTAAVLLVGLSFVLWHSIPRLLHPQPVHAPGMAMLAVLGILFNGAAVLRVRHGSSLTERVVSWHLLEDTLGWVAVLAGAAAMWLWDVPWIDPLLSIGVAAFVLLNVLRNLRQFRDVFLQKAPAGFDVHAFEQALLRLPRVRSVHHTHSWSIDGEAHVLTTHLVMERGTPRDAVVGAKSSTRALLDRATFVHVTIDVELEGEPCAGAPSPS